MSIRLANTADLPGIRQLIADAYTTYIELEAVLGEQRSNAVLLHSLGARATTALLGLRIFQPIRAV